MLRKILLVLLLIPALLSAGNEKLAFIYYYAWYGTPDSDGAWLHWSDYDHKPPRDVSSAFYPKLGAYSSSDPSVLEQHIRWIAGANINVIVYSWWGKNDPTDEGAQRLLDLAADYALKVVFMIEPYPGRTPQSLCNDIESLNQRFSNHPAMFKMSRKILDNSSRRRPLFLIYQPDFYTEHELKEFARRVHNAPDDSLLLLQSTDVGLAERTGMDGMFAYEAYQNVQHFYTGLVNAAKKAGLIFIPCVSPGFNVNRTFSEKSQVFRPRRYGRTYDDWWEKVLAADADYVGIISFNEWHEGTQIEPAVRPDFKAQKYLSYDGAYGKRGPAAEDSFLRRTARWIQLFQTGAW